MILEPWLPKLTDLRKGPRGAAHPLPENCRAFLELDSPEGASRHGCTAGPCGHEGPHTASYGGLHPHTTYHVHWYDDPRAGKP